ncbi:MAG: MarR family winged helix-turn-helix transcriptional regulator [Myxococcota bacterium]
MDVDRAVLQVQALYPRVWHRMHRRHPTDRSDLSPRDVGVLVHIADADGASPGDLAEHLGVAPGTLSEALGDLEARGLLTRSRHPDDRRRVAVSLTPAGRDAVAAGSGLDPERLARALATLDPDERARAIAGLALLARACAAVTP